MNTSENAAHLLQAAYHDPEAPTGPALAELTAATDHAALCQTMAAWITTTHTALHTAGAPCLPTIVMACPHTAPPPVRTAVNIINAATAGNWAEAGEAAGAAIAADITQPTAAALLELCASILRSAGAPPP